MPENLSDVILERVLKGYHHQGYNFSQGALEDFQMLQYLQMF